MAAYFDLEKLDTLLKDFHRITGIRITVFDENRKELISYPVEVAPCCGTIRSCAEGLSACVVCDQDACATAARTGKLYVYRCHAGLTEAVVPLSVDGVTVGYLLFGHIFSYSSHREGWRVIRSRCESLPIDLKKLKEEIENCEPLEDGFIRSSAHILEAVASYLILERMAVVQKEKIATMLDAYLASHFTEKISAQVLCDVLGIGKTQLYKLSEQLYGCGIAKRIRDLRMDLAKRLLKSDSAYTLADIAQKCGFSDYNYFITVFSREVGVSPVAYRNS